MSYIVYISIPTETIQAGIDSFVEQGGDAEEFNPPDKIRKLIEQALNIGKHQYPDCLWEYTFYDNARVIGLTRFPDTEYNLLFQETNNDSTDKQ